MGGAIASRTYRESSAMLIGECSISFLLNLASRPILHSPSSATYDMTSFEEARVLKKCRELPTHYALRHYETRDISVVPD